MPLAAGAGPIDNAPVPKSSDSLRRLILSHVPADGSTIGNIRLRQVIADVTGREVDEDLYTLVRDELVEEGVLIRGPGRGGSVRLADAEEADVEEEDEDELEEATGDEDEADVEQDPGDDDDGDADAESGEGEGFRLEAPTVAAAKARRGRSKSGGRKERSETTSSAVLSYRHGDRRKNNPEVGVTMPTSDPAQPKTVWKYDPHLDPELQFDVGRSEVERVIDDALAAGSEDAMREALKQLRRQAEPYLAWTGKAERTSFEVDTVSLHVHERVDPLSILSAAREKAKGEKRAGSASGAVMQLGLFAAPFENLPMRDAIDFYRHDRGWANRLVAGDSLLVMNSLLQKESMAGQVQMVYIDPPYGIKYGSNFQPFVGQRRVEDRKDKDLTREPETIKAFRDTWELGIHSYLTYLRDRILLSRDLLADSGSIFVQISDANVHLVRQVMDEVFGVENYLNTIPFLKTMGVTTKFLASNVDFIIWYAKDKAKAKYNALYSTKSLEEGTASTYGWIQERSGKRRGLSKREKAGLVAIPDDAEIYKPSDITSQGNPAFDFVYAGATYAQEWKTNERGLTRLAKAGRLHIARNSLQYVRLLRDFPCVPVTQLWTDTLTGSFTEDKVYVVQTAEKVIERCLLLTTDPGDLVFDPTCGSGTTAVVAERWGRRWITCDTSRVAITLAKQRLMTAGFDYFELKYPLEGLKAGFVYETVPHVTLKAIANNAEVDEVWDRSHLPVVAALAELNRALRSNMVPPLKVDVGGRRGMKVDFSAPASKKANLPSGEEAPVGTLMEWEVPHEFPAAWPKVARPAFDAFQEARSALWGAMDASISAHSEQEILYDKPRPAKDKTRITGPFTVEAVPFPTVLALDETPLAAEADVTVARSGESSRHHQWRDELLRTGVRGKGGQRLSFASLETLPDTRHLHASGHLADSGDRVVVSFGPEHATLEQRQVEMAMQEAGELFPRPKMIVFCAFAFDPEAAKDIDQTKGVVALKVQMNTDLLTEDLKKARSSNQSFWLMGQPEVEVHKRKDGTFQVEVHGFDYFDTVKGTLVSGGKAKIAMWMLDTDYDDRSLFPRQVFFPMAGGKDGWNKLRKTIRAELDEDKLDAFHGTVSLPFDMGDHKKVAVKIIDDRGIESLKVVRLD